jgi:hypothetical protein
MTTHELLLVWPMGRWLVFELLPEGTTFQINGEKLSISVPESLATQQAKA